MTGIQDPAFARFVRLRPVIKEDLLTLHRNELDPDAHRMAVVKPRDA